MALHGPPLTGKMGGGPGSPNPGPNAGGGGGRGMGMRGGGGREEMGGRRGGRMGGPGRGDYSSPRPMHPGTLQGAPMPSLPTRVSSAPPAENVQVYESTHGYYRHAMDNKQAFPQRRPQPPPHVGQQQMAPAMHPHYPPQPPHPSSTRLPRCTATRAGRNFIPSTAAARAGLGACPSTPVPRLPA